MQFCNRRSAEIQRSCVSLGDGGCRLVGSRKDVMSPPFIYRCDYLYVTVYRKVDLLVVYQGLREPPLPGPLLFRIQTLRAMAGYFVLEARVFKGLGECFNQLKW